LYASSIVSLKAMLLLELRTKSNNCEAKPFNNQIQSEISAIHLYLKF